MSTYVCRLLQREGTRDLFEHRRPAMPSDDEDADNNDDVMDSSDEAEEQDGEDES